MSANSPPAFSVVATSSTPLTHDIDVWMASAWADGGGIWYRCPSTETAKRC